MLRKTKVSFKVTRLLDPVKQGGKLKVGGVFSGTLTKGLVDRVEFEDANGLEWVFYPGETCEIIDQEIKAPEDPLQSKINFLKGQLKSLDGCGLFSKEEIEDLKIPIESQLNELCNGE